MNTQSLIQGRKYIITGAIGGASGLFFMLLHIPVPWLLGPMMSMVIGSNLVKYNFKWNAFLRNIGMMIIGYTIGLSMTAQALKDITIQLPLMLLMTLALLTLCSIIAFFISKISDSNYNTLLLAGIPGGLLQVLILAEETKDINLAIVTITQIIRLIIIIISMPLLILLPFFQGESKPNNVGMIYESATVNLFPIILLFIIVALIFTFVFVKIRFPTAILLGPMIGTILLQLVGIEGPELPDAITNVAQLLIGLHIGLMLDISELPNKIRTISLAFASGVLLVAGSIMLSLLLTTFQPLSKATGLLSLAPGGMEQMGIIAHEINADLSIVSGYQLFRTFFIFFAVPPMIKWFMHWMNKNKRSDDSLNK